MFGAAVRADGSPSPTLRRRIAYAAASSAIHPDADIFCSGAVGRNGPSEASVMADALGRSIDRSRIHLDEASADTLESVRAATDFARTHGHDQCVVCTDRYHQFRVRMLFTLFGMPSRSIVFAKEQSRTSANYRWKMRTREALAIPYDLVAGLAARVRGL